VRAPLRLNSSDIAVISLNKLLFPADFSADNIFNLCIKSLGSDDNNLTDLIPEPECALFFAISNS